MDQKAMERAFYFVEELRKIHPEMQLQMAAILLAVASKGEMPQSEIGLFVGLKNKATVSRNLKALGEREGGFGLIQIDKNLDDYRINTVRLTPKGERVVRSLLQYVREG